MRTAVSVKQCPKCKTAAALESTECRDCGHRFRTHFVDVPLRTEPFEMLILPAAPESRPSTSRPLLRSFGWKRMLPAVLLSGLLWLCWSSGETPSLSHQTAAEASTLPPPVQAEHLYKGLRLAMSLYDVDQAAGGMGRVLRVPDPHTLILSYDYSDQRVQVLLDRADVSSNDYEVQAVALYRGRTLLQRHAGEE